MAHITKIKAGSTPSSKEPTPVPSKKEAGKATAKAAKPAKKAEPQASKPAKPTKVSKGKGSKNPFKAAWGYLKGSWQEIRQVRWPNRKATWKMLFAVLIYAALFIVIITLLDIFFQWIFKLILG